jgi:hypothetical protein
MPAWACSSVVRIGNRLRLRAEFASGLKLVKRVQIFEQKYSCFIFSEMSYIMRRPAATRGALRDRHERWRQDAVDASARETSAPDADGESAWSWSPDAGIKRAGDDPARDGGNKARSPGRARHKR